MFSAIRWVRERLERAARDFDASLLTGEQAVWLVKQLGALRRLIDGLLAKAAKRVDDTGAYRDLGDRDAAAFCGRLVGIGVAEARRAIDTAAKLESLPATDDAVRDGLLSARQAQMIVDAARINPDAECDLIATASEGLVPLMDACIAARAVVEDGAARAARQHSARHLRTWRSTDGMVEGHFRLPPEIGGPFTTAIDTETQRIFRERHAAGDREPHDRYAADALVAAVLGVADAAATGTGVKTVVHIVINHSALVRGDISEGETCEIPGVGPVSVAWVRELLGSAFVTAVIKNGKDITTVAHLGRHIPAELQTAMIVGGRECDVENCHGRGYLERDHSEVDFAKGGATAYWNLAWLCYVHHRLKTMGWKLGPPDPTTGKRTLRAPGEGESAAA
jgi:hypothetical protein